MDVNKWIAQRRIFECISGSHAYGLNTPESDIDYRGVCIPPKDYIVGLRRFEQFESKDPDRTIFGIHKFMDLATQNNPNILELLFMPDDTIVLKTKLWDMIRENRYKFLSSRCRFKYAGYAFSQVKRVKSHRQWLLSPPTEKPTRDKYGLPEYEKLSYELMGAIESVVQNAIRSELDNILTVENLLSSDALTLIKTTIKDDVCHEISESLYEYIEPHITKILNTNDVVTDLGQKFFSKDIMLIYNKEKSYKNAMAKWKQYENWKATRNEKRSELEAKYGYDTKHMSHVFRLIIQCEQILKECDLSVRLRAEDREFVLAIKQGAYSYEEHEEIVNNKLGTDDKPGIFDELYKTTTLQKNVDLNIINELTMKIIEESYS